MFEIHLGELWSVNCLQTAVCRRLSAVLQLDFKLLV
jgi:hypothetical protein